MLKNLKVGHRLGGAFALLLAMLLGLAATAIALTGRLHENTEYFADNLIPSVRVIGDALERIRAGRTIEGQYLIVEGDEHARLRKNLLERRAETESLLAGYEKTVSDADDRRLWQAVRDGASAYWPLQDKVLALADAGDLAGARQTHLYDSRAVFNKLRDHIAAWNAHNQKIGEERLARSRESYAQIKLMLTVGTLAALALGVLATLVITRSITAPLAEAVAVAERVAGGDLGRAPASDRNDELGHLLRALGGMTDKLSTLVREVRNGTDAIALASSEIATGNADLSARTESQAASLEQTAASMEEMTGSVRSSADSARQAERLASGTSDAALRGGDAVARVVATMNDIQTASRRIGDIIGVIDGIAFQTNILALNAAVEAARAGDQGRGFAVVASEVRVLAQRSAEAAREIKSLILDSNARVDAGNAIVGEAGGTIGEVVTQVRRVNDLVAEISSAIGEQDSGIGQINMAVSQLDQATQQNAALVEQTAAAAESLKLQAARLAEALTVFRLGGQG
ncbi:methyl-accepting chemotaxis protein [Derxia lacustris]|uniref:methyl-accepting chemotaxis protein n=1 Tax=Derxia lacustris TaxID=764842 RepID=UPI000A172234|nr:methyl-accepting chemotaxis protein [Derxia lacustris]